VQFGKLIRHAQLPLNLRHSIRRIRPLDNNHPVKARLQTASRGQFVFTPRKKIAEDAESDRESTRIGGRILKNLFLIVCL
jgi:hypothetical protein